MYLTDTLHVDVLYRKSQRKHERFHLATNLLIFSVWQEYHEQRFSLLVALKL
jgi:hypothetical protein